MNIPDSGKVDFSVEALTGYYNDTVSRYPVPGGEFHTLTFIGESSGWSSIQTIDIPATSNSITPIPSPTIPEFPITLSLVAVLVAVSLLLVMGKRKLTTINH